MAGLVLAIHVFTLNAEVEPHRHVV
jgi:hypothetical protein